MTPPTKETFRWWGWLLLPLNLLGVIVALPALLLLWIGDDCG